MAMKVELKDVREHPVELRVNCSPESLELEDEEFEFPDPVQGNVVFAMAGDKVMARGKVATTVESKCVRCLKSVRTPVEAAVDFLYERRDHAPTPEEEIFGGGDSDDRLAYFQGESIQPEPQLREALMLELPQLPLCQENCAGLCPVCGADLNLERCECNRAPDDGPGWKSALRNLKIE